MSGYTPAFADMYMGTLYGRWPAAAVWATLLPLMDKHGRIDMSMQAIAGMTGWPLDLLELGIEQLMEPDPASRTPGHDGRRLIPIDPSRPLGWVAVNHGKYRERARKQVHDERRQQSGENAARMAARRQEPSEPTEPDATREDPTRPDATRRDPLSDTNTNTEKRARKKRSSRAPPDFIPDLDFARREVPDIDAEREAQKFRDWEFKTARSDWPATWRTWIGTCRDTGRYARAPKANGSMGEWR